ncbi:hypothetical protein LTR66_008840, partial [Elasticomyces elasticus]
CIEEPNSDPKEEKEPAEAAIWEAMDGLAQFSQVSVVEWIGVFVRMEAIRTEKYQTRYQPLQPYMDEKSIGDHAQPWKQTLMFFAPTQREHEFTRRQREAWEALMEQAERKVNGEEEEGEEGMGQEDKDDERVGESKEGEENDDDNSSNDKQREAERLPKIQKVCLHFCIELLDQSVTRREYDSALACALAVLGVEQDGWKGPEQYPPVLSAMIKVARFMVVQQALESEPFEKDEFGGDGAYESDGSANASRPGKKGCLQLVARIMERFIVRESHGPMQ